MAKGNVSISAEEYKELLLKEKPTDKDREILKRIFDIIEPRLTYTDRERGYYTSTIMENVEVKKSDEIISELFTMLKYVDFDKYMEIWNKVMTNERKRKDELEKIEQMNTAKEIRKNVSKAEVESF